MYSGAQILPAAYVEWGKERGGSEVASTCERLSFEQPKRREIQGVRWGVSMYCRRLDGRHS